MAGQAEVDASDELRYRHVAIDGETLGAALRGAADFIDRADTMLGEAVLVVELSHELMLDVAPGGKPWRVRLLADEDDLAVVLQQA